MVNGTRIQYFINTDQGPVVHTWAGVCLVLWFDATVLFQSVHVQSCHQLCYQGHKLDFNLPYSQCCIKLKLFLAPYLQNHSITCMFVVAKHGRISWRQVYNISGIRFYILFLLTDFIMESCDNCLHIKERKRLPRKSKKIVNLTEIHETL